MPGMNLHSNNCSTLKTINKRRGEKCKKMSRNKKVLKSIFCMFVISVKVTSVLSSAPPPCGSIVLGSGIIQSPGYPSNYPSDVNCTWTLIAGLPDGNIRLDFHTFSTEPCCDYLSISNATHSEFRLYGNAPSKLILGTWAVLRFYSDVSITGFGFNLNFTTTAEAEEPFDVERFQCERNSNYFCGQNRVCLAWFARCDGFPNCSPYGEDELGCNSTVTAAPTLSRRDSCTQQGNFYCVRSDLCVNISNRCDGVFSCRYGEDELGCNNLSIAINVSRTPGGPCGSVLHGSGIIQSPGYPAFYPNNARCNWTLTAERPDAFIRLDIQNFSTESCCDFLSITNASGYELRLYGSAPSTLIIGNESRLLFYSDDSVNFPGFSITFTTTSDSGLQFDLQLFQCERNFNFFCNVSRMCILHYYRCDGTLNCPYGDDESGCNRSTTLTASAGTTTSVPEAREVCQRNGNFYCERSGLCTDSGNRCDGYYDCSYGEDESGCDVLIAPTVSTATTRTPSTRDACLRQGKFYCELSTTCLGLWQRCDGFLHCFYGEDENGCSSMSSLTSRSQSTAAPCGGTFYGSGLITSPNYPQPYSDNIYCVWNLHSYPTGHTLLLEFRIFETERNHSIVSIYYENGSVKEYSGANKPPKMLLGTSGRVVFTSNRSSSAIGFYLNFISTEFSSASGELKSNGLLVAASSYVAAVLLASGRRSLREHIV